MTARISIGNGRYCYSGPTCKLHGAQQVKEARIAMQLASSKVGSATTFDEIKAAKDELAKATLAYDATTEGQETLKMMIQEINHIDSAPLVRRFNEAKAYAEEFEKKSEKSVTSEADENGLVPLVVNDSFSYKEPTTTVVGEDEYYPARVGSKYDGWKSVTEVAKNVRADIKEAQEQGYLPKNLAYAVKGDKYSGGQSMTVTVQNVRDEDIYEPSDDPYRRFPTPAARELERRVKAIASAYNSDSSRAEVDYFQTMYYSRVTIETKSEREYRVKEASQAKAKRDAKPLRESFKKDYTSDPAKALQGINFTHSNERSTVGRVGDSQIFVHKSEIMGRTRVSAYDLSDMNFPDGGPSPEEHVLKYAGNQHIERKNFLKARKRRA